MMCQWMAGFQNVQVPNQTVIILQVISSADESDGLATEKNDESDDEDLEWISQFQKKINYNTVLVHQLSFDIILTTE